MTLGEFIAALEALPAHLLLDWGIEHPHSYRGYYNDLAFEKVGPQTVAEALTVARSALGQTYQGWKGGGYTMTEWVDVYCATEGSVGSEIVLASDAIVVPIPGLRSEAG